MKTRRRTTYGLFIVASGLVALAAAAMPPGPKPARPLAVDDPIVNAEPHVLTPPVVPAQPDPPGVDVVFALDTTGSMEGLIDGAKRKIWNIANYISQAQPKPEVRIGLVGYRDIGDAYVTRFYDLSDDMDTVFQHLSSFRAEGGGDTPEHVARALHDAVDRSSWSQGNKVVKMVYLVGDAPPHTDYHDGYDYRAISMRAKQMGIHINTILCGNDHSAEVAWREISGRAGGEYASIAQSGGVVAVATPYDSKLADLNRRLAGTAMGYGRHRLDIEGKVGAAMAAPTSIAADRAGYAGANGLAVSGDGELLNDIARGHAKLSAIPKAELPAPMKSMSLEQQNAYIASKVEERKKVLSEINELSKSRNEFLKADAKKGKRPAGFDDSVRSTVEKEASGVLSF